MKNEDVSIWMKVVPTKKTSLGWDGLEQSSEWQHCKKINQPFMYVTGFDSEDGWILSHTTVLDDGDFFLADDFYPYMPEYSEMNTAPKDGTRFMAWDSEEKEWLRIAWLYNPRTERQEWCCPESYAEEFGYVVSESPVCWTPFPNPLTKKEEEFYENKEIDQ